MIGFCFLFDTGTQSIAFSVTGYVLLPFISHSPRFLLTTSALKQREVPATVSSFYVSVLYTAMLRTSIAAVFLAASISVL